jgi:dimethylhistidine N-methyltransferase
MAGMENGLAEFIKHALQDRDAIRNELVAGLMLPQAVTSPKYLYDALGSKLFEAICELPEYYPTRTEAEIFRTHGAEIASVAGLGSTLIDLGAGNCAKAASLFSLLRPQQYVPIDISAEFLHDAVTSLQQQFSHIDMLALGMDFSSALELPATVRRHNRLFFYPGSSIGNFNPDEVLAFIKRLRGACDIEGGLLIGVDLVKDSATLDAAYDDALGVTASFNLNLLLHLNRLLGADFNLRQWRHRGFFNADASRVEMHLEATDDTVVRWNGGQRRFVQGERLHTENSYKYTVPGFTALLEQAGFGQVRVWRDPRQWFMVCHARAI